MAPWLVLASEEFGSGNPHGGLLRGHRQGKRDEDRDGRRDHDGGEACLHRSSSRASAAVLEGPPPAPCKRPGSPRHPTRYEPTENGTLWTIVLARQLVRHLDFEPVLALGETPERHRLPGDQLVPERRIELRRQRRGVEVLRVRLVEELLAVFGGRELLVEAVFHRHVGLLVGVLAGVVDDEHHGQLALLRELVRGDRRDLRRAQRVGLLAHFLGRQRRGQRRDVGGKDDRSWWPGRRSRSSARSPRASASPYL